MEGANLRYRSSVFQYRFYHHLNGGSVCKRAAKVSGFSQMEPWIWHIEQIGTEGVLASPVVCSFLLHHLADHDQRLLGLGRCEGQQLLVRRDRFVRRAAPGI